MKIKTLSLALAILLLCAFFTACNIDNKTKEKYSIEEQINVIAESSDTWIPFDIYPGDNFKVAVTDLDNNSRLEVVTTVCRGTGRYSESMYYEVNETFTSLTKWEHKTDDSKGGLQPDIISGKGECFINPETGERFYAFVDTIRASGDYSTHTKGSLTFNDNIVNFTSLATCTSIAENPENITINTYTYADTNGNNLTKEEFDSYIENYFEGYEKHTVTFKWQKLNLDSDTVNEDFVKLLNESFEGFSVK